MYKPIVKIAYPIAISRLLNVLLDICSVFFLAKLGVAYLAAYGLAMPLYLSVYMITISYLLIYSVKATYLKDSKPRYAAYFYTTVLFALGLSAISTIIYCLLPSLLGYLGQSQNLVDKASNFFYFITIGIPPLFLSSILSQTFIVASKNKVVTFAAIMQFLIGLVAMYFFTIKLGLNLKGVALGFDIAYWCKFLYLLLTFISRKSITKVTWSRLKAHFTEDFKFLRRLGWPISLQYGGELIAAAVASLLIGHLYSHALAGQQLAAQIRVLLLMIPYSLSQACAIIATRVIKSSQGNKQQAIKKIEYSAIKIAIACCAPILVLINFFAVDIIKQFIHPGYQHLITLTLYFLMITSMSIILDCFKYCLGGILRGMSNTRSSMLFSLMSYWGLGIPLAFILGYPLHLGPVGVRLGMLSGLLFGTISLYFYYRQLLKNEDVSATAVC